MINKAIAFWKESSLLRKFQIPLSFLSLIPIIAWFSIPNLFLIELAFFYLWLVWINIICKFFNWHFILWYINFLLFFILLETIFVNKSIIWSILVWLIMIFISTLIFWKSTWIPERLEENNWHKIRAKNKLYEAQWLTAKANWLTTFKKDKFIQLRKDWKIDGNGNLI